MLQKCSKGDVQRSLYSPTAQYSIDEASLSKLRRKHLTLSLTPFLSSLSLTTCFSLFFSMTHNFILSPSLDCPFSCHSSLSKKQIFLFLFSLLLFPLIHPLFLSFFFIFTVFSLFIREGVREINKC